jgi:hypothetical protein
LDEHHLSMTTGDDERLSLLIGPARAMLARVDALSLKTQRSIAACLFGVVFCLSGAAAAAAAAVAIVAPGQDKAVVIVAAVGMAACAGLFGYAIAVLRVDLIPLSTFGQELRGGLRNAEQALFDDATEYAP